MKITFAYWGNYTIAFNSLFRKLGVDFISPEKTNPKAIQAGAKISPEMYCFPLKVNIGNYLPAIEKGADTIFMVTSLSGSCRLRYYGIIQSKALLEAGHKVDFIIFNQSPRDIYSKLKKISGASCWQILAAGDIFFKKLRLIEKLKKKAQYLRPREKTKGQTDSLLKLALIDLEKTDQAKEVLNLEKQIFTKISAIELQNDKVVPRIGIIGEIFTVTDETVNFGIEAKLGKGGIEVYREMDVTYHLKKAVFPWKDWKIQRAILPYLRSTVGGHGRDAIYEMLDYAKRDFDGIVHLLPFGCMPETTVRPILEKIHQESRMPFLCLSLDEQVAQAGIDTRIEAFIDVVNNYFKQKKEKVKNND